MKRSKKNKNTTQQTVVGEIKRAGQRGHSPGRRLLLRVSQRCPQFAIHTGTSPGCFGELGRNRESINPLRESPPPVPGRRIRRAPAPPGGTAAVLAAGAGREIKLIKNKAESGGGGRSVKTSPLRDPQCAPRRQEEESAGRGAQRGADAAPAAATAAVPPPPSFTRAPAAAAAATAPLPPPPPAPRRVPGAGARPAAARRRSHISAAPPPRRRRS